ncbi:hypothetical protein UPYG_G00020920 [Umbra pygmaea]|uniref:Immunoglobulin C1-set domain-containing protein n=1 Tax=Umbra pygmaea TaxID=75934 RepID=A0ABD0XKV3_UMBPY
MVVFSALTELLAIDKGESDRELPIPLHYISPAPYCISAESSTSASASQPARTVGVVRPSLTILLPSSEQQDQGNVVLVCLANRGFPGDWKLGWRLGAGGALQGNQSPEVVEKDGHYSWSTSLTLPTY